VTVTGTVLRERWLGRAQTTAGGVGLLVAVTGATVIVVASLQPRLPVLGDVAWAGAVLSAGFAAAVFGGLAAGLALVIGPRWVLLCVTAAGGLLGIGLAVTAVVQILGAEAGPGRTLGIGAGMQTGVLGCVLVALGGLSALLAPTSNPAPTGS